MGKVIFLFKNITIINTSLEDLETTEDFLNCKDVDELGYSASALAEAYARLGY